MNKLIFVTGNDNKAREAALVLGRNIERVKIDLDELQSMDLRVIVEHKARQAYAKLKTSARGGPAVIVEDVSFKIKQWGGFPGPFIKWLHSSMGYVELCKSLSGNRAVDWVVAYGYFDGRRFVYAEAVVKGSIANLPRGGDGWGFDVIFIPKGKKQTTSELGQKEKIKFSARTKALITLRRLLGRSR